MNKKQKTNFDGLRYVAVRVCFVLLCLLAAFSLYVSLYVFAPL